MNEQTFANVRLNRSKVQLGILMLSCLLGLILLAQPSSGPVRAAPAAGESQLGASQSSDGGTFIPIDDPLGVKGTHAWGINPQGDIVGSYDDADNVRHGFLLRDGKFMTIDNPDGGDGPPGPLGNQGTTLYDINASGDITGRYIDSNNIAHSFYCGMVSSTPWTPRMPGLRRAKELKLMVSMRAVTSSALTLTATSLITASCGMATPM